MGLINYPLTYTLTWALENKTSTASLIFGQKPTHLNISMIID
jgi:hypothetical protein